MYEQIYHARRISIILKAQFRGAQDMNDPTLGDIYRAYLDCLNRQDWDNLGQFVSENARHNGRPFGLSGYRAMLERDFEEIPDLRFSIQLLVVDTPNVASRLWFDCTPRGTFMGLAVNGRRVSFAENVFYRFHDGRIEEVWSVIDQSAIEAQLRP
jgi:predicted ester cyclase